MSKKTSRIPGCILGILYGLTIVFGYQARNFGEIRVKSPLTYLSILLWSGVAAGFFLLTWEGLQRHIGGKKPNERPDENPSREAVFEDTKKKRRFPDPVWPVSSALIFLFYFINLLGVYPGFFVYDAGYELDEVLKRRFDNQHPLFHVLSMGGVIQGVHKITGDYNLSIAAFILFQAAVSALIYGWMIREFTREIIPPAAGWKKDTGPDRGGASKQGDPLKTHGKGILFIAVWVLYLGLFPVIVMYALCSAKDGLFTGFMLMTILYIRRYLKDRRDFEGKKSPSFWLLVSFAVLMMLYRNNGVYAFLIFGVLAVFILYFRGIDERKPAIAFVLSVLIFGAVSRILTLGTRAGDVGHREILTVPIQQMARIAAYDPESLSAEEKSAVLKYIPEEGIRHYTPKCSDEVKIEFDEGAYEQDKAGFYRLYLKLGLKHPSAYLTAWVMTSYGMWDPNAVIDGYGGRSVYTFTYGESSYFGYETEPPGERKPFIPFIDRFFRWISLDPWIQRAPVIRLLFAPGFLLWVYLYFFGFLVFSGKRERALPYILPLCVVFTCLFGPMSLVRYVYYLWILVPMLVYDSLRTDDAPAGKRS
ncbi:MAG: DUF6020 family protein [Lachnospiraceae bacterium]|nr:DUF6020 family protein [Lachnospiraceae bacterium]